MVHKLSHSCAKYSVGIARWAVILLSTTFPTDVLSRSACMSSLRWLYSYRLDSLYSPPKATTVLTAESTSSATAPADAYSFCSRSANNTVNCKGAKWLQCTFFLLLRPTFVTCKCYATNTRVRPHKVNFLFLRDDPDSRDRAELFPR